MLAAQLVEPRFQHLDALADQPAVGFELRLAGAAQADATLLPLEVGPGPNQAGREVLQLRELDLQLAFVAARALREDVENEARTIDDAPIKHSLQIALLSGCERVIEDDDFDVVRFAGKPQFVGFAAADEQGGVGAGAAARQRDGGMGARAGGEQAEFFETGFEIGLAEIDAD